MRILNVCVLAALLVLGAAFNGGAQQEAGKEAPPKEKAVEKKKSMERVNGRTYLEWSDLVKDKDISTKEKAIAALKFYGSMARRDVPEILKVLNGTQHDVSLKVNAIITLGYIGIGPEQEQIDQGVRVLIRALHDPQGIVRFQACQALARLERDAYAAVGDLVAASRDRASWEIRSAALWALSTVAWSSEGYAREAWNAAIKALGDNCAEVRYAAICCLIIFGQPASPIEKSTQIRALQSLITERQNKKVAIWARLAVMRTTGDASEGHLKGISQFLTNRDQEARSNAARSLAVVGPDAASQVPQLLRALEQDDNDPMVIMWIARALTNIGDAKEALPILEKSKNHPDAGARQAVQVAIEVIKEGRKVEYLTKENKGKAKSKKRNPER